MLDISCYEAVKAFLNEANAPFVYIDVAETYDSHDGTYNRETNTITINPRVCKKPRAMLKWVALHELGHSVAVKLGDMSEEGADRWAKGWYGDVAALLAYVKPMCEGGSGYGCYIERVMK